MLGLPYNRCESNGTIEETLKKFLFSKGINDFNDVITFKQARECAISSLEPCEAHFQNLVRFHGIMKSIAPRLDEYDTEINLKFTCVDGFLPSKKITKWANTIWNMAVNESLRGARVDRSTEEGIRIASRHFQQAAGLLSYLKTEVTVNIKGGGIVGHSDEGLHMSIQLMLAQAQLCFYEKAIRDRKSGNTAITSSVIAKLAYQTALFYNETASTCNTGILPNILDASWKSHEEFQAALFFAAAEYWASISAKEAVQTKGIGYGEEIARLTKSENYLLQALSIAEKNKITSSTTAGAEILLRTVKMTKETAENENRTIFLEAIPSDDSLAKISPVVMVKASGMPQYYDDGKVLFKDINSKSVQQVKIAVQERIDSALKSATVDAGNATNEARVVLSSVGLPGSLETYKAGGVLPDALWQKIVKARSLCSLSTLENKYKELELATQRATLALNNINDTIQREINNDESFRLQFPQFNGVTSVTCTADIKAHKDKMSDALQVARNTDEVTLATMRTSSYVEGANLLTLSKEELQNLLPQASAPLIDFTDVGMSNATFIDTSSLERKLMEMADIIGQRDGALKILSTMSSVDITDGVMADIRSGNNDIKTLIENYLTDCTTQMEVIKQTLIRQDPLLQEILNENEIFTKNRASDPITNETDKIIRNLEQSISSSLNIYAQLNAGVTFYSSLQSKLTNLIQSAEDISYSQQLLRQEFENQLMYDFEKSTQEQKDREFAQTLSDELAAVNVSTAANMGPVPNTYPQSNAAPDLASYPAVPGPRKPQKPLPSNVYPGDLIAAPPSNVYPGSIAAINSPHPNPNVPPAYSNIQPGYPQQQYPIQYPPTSPNTDIHQKANRISEMGFALHDCMNALTQNNGNEEAALNMLLSNPQQQPINHQQQYQSHAQPQFHQQQQYQQQQYDQQQQQYHQQQQYQPQYHQPQQYQPQYNQSPPPPSPPQQQQQQQPPQQQQPQQQGLFNYLWKKPN